MIAYLNGEYLEKDKIRISPDDRGFLFSDGLYEVVRFYNGKPFRIKEHQNRIENGAKVLRFSRTKFEEFSEVIETLQFKNNLENVKSAIVYFQATRGSAPRSHSFPSKETPLTVYAFAREFKSNIDEQQNGAKAITVTDDRWANCDLNT
jgi:D-alanine transaminase